MDESAARRIGLHIATALATAHDAGILHRDVKPGNVPRSPRSGDPVLADFGIARLVGGTATATGLVSGTIAYSAPEVLEGRGATAQSDIYSLGAMLFAALAGHPPYVLGSGEVNGGGHLTNPHRATARHSSDCPVVPGFADVLARCLDREPARRFASAHDVATALESTIARQSTAPETRTVARSALREWPSAFYCDTDLHRVFAADGTPVAHGNRLCRGDQARPNPVQAAQFGGARIVRDSLGMPASASGQNAVVFRVERSHRAAGPSVFHP